MKDLKKGVYTGNYAGFGFIPEEKSDGVFNIKDSYSVSYTGSRHFKFVKSEGVLKLTGENLGSFNKNNNKKINKNENN